jgi:uncharacterized membrane protein YbaN (DUF454 family)
MSSATIKKAVFAGLGWLFFSVGVVGAFLPVLPTTPFMLLALWAFSKSSERLHNFLWNHPKYGMLLRNWKEHGIIPLKAKITALVMMSASAVFMVLFSNIPLPMIVATLIFMLIGAIYMSTRPGLKKLERSLE